MGECSSLSVESRKFAEDAINMLKESGQQDIQVLDIACGKGGDLRKWSKGRVKSVVMIGSLSLLPISL